MRGAVADGGAAHQEQVLGRELHDVGEGEVAEVDGVGGEVGARRDTEAGERSHHARVLQQNTLGHAGGPRGVHDDSDVIGLGGDGSDGLGGAEGLDLLHADDLDALELGNQVRGHIAHGDDILEVRALGGHAREHLEELAVGDHHGGAGLVEPVLDALRAQGRVHRGDSEVLGESGLRRNHPLGLGLGVDGELVTRLHAAERHETRGEVFHADLQLGVGHPNEVLGEGNLLEFALDVDLQDLADAHGVPRAVVLERSLGHGVEGVEGWVVVRVHLERLIVSAAPRVCGALQGDGVGSLPLGVFGEAVEELDAEGTSHGDATRHETDGSHDL
mmetsp:Transcript_6049/g.20714  ORF Transcript_6049/g.20714 Transcript_6049/m.20714 type:complete len:331 (+) Transcript_6049:1042-2034(+)